MNLDPTWLFLSLFPSGAGLILLAYGRKAQRPPQVVAGVALMVYPYFTASTGALIIVGLLIGIGLWSALRLGW